MTDGSGTSKVCTRCGESKPLDAFGTRVRNSDGKRGRCKECEKQDREAYLARPDRLEKVKAWRRQYHVKYRDEHLAENRRWRAANPLALILKRRDNLLRKFGLTFEEYEKILAAQGGRCAICRSLATPGLWRRLHIDHCHATGKVRGLLCTNCNLAIGQFKDDPAVVRAAADYIEKAGGQ